MTFTANLGLPSLGALGVGGGTVLDLLSGSHTAHVWYDGTERLRLALDSPQAETDWIRNGDDLWSWDSSSQAVKHVNLASVVDEASNPSSSASASVVCTEEVSRQSSTDA